MVVGGPGLDEIVDRAPVFALEFLADIVGLIVQFVAQLLDLSPRSAEYIRDADMGKKTDGYSQALFVVEEDQYPLRIEMSDEVNPRQFAVYQHDPTDHAPTKEYLADYTDDQGRDPCNWRWER